MNIVGNNSSSPLYSLYEELVLLTELNTGLSTKCVEWKNNQQGEKLKVNLENFLMSYHANVKQEKKEEVASCNDRIEQDFVGQLWTLLKGNIINYGY